MADKKRGVRKLEAVLTVREYEVYEKFLRAIFEAGQVQIARFWGEKMLLKIVREWSLIVLVINVADETFQKRVLFV